MTDRTYDRISGQTESQPNQIRGLEGVPGTNSVLVGSPLFDVMSEYGKKKRHENDELYQVSKHPKRARLIC